MPMIAAMADSDTEEYLGCDLHSRDTFWSHLDANSASRQEPQTDTSKIISVTFPCDITGPTCPLRRTFALCAFLHSSLGDISGYVAILRQVEACLSRSPQGQESRVTKDIHSSTPVTCTVCQQGPGTSIPIAISLPHS